METSVAEATISAPAHFPKSVLTVSRQEFDQLVLTVKKGDSDEEVSLEPGLHGYVFIVGPAGSVDSPVVDVAKKIIQPTQDGFTPLYNGDGLLQRIGFEEGQARLTTRIARTPSCIADELSDEKYPLLKFKNLGITRASTLGVTTQLSVTLTPFRFAETDPYRLMVSVDMGRPYEVNPVTLVPVQPIGYGEGAKAPETFIWKGVNPLISWLTKAPFSLSMSTAHPSFDFDTGELFTTNLGRSLTSFSPWLRRLATKFPDTAQKLARTAHPEQQGFVPWLLRLFLKLIEWIAGWLLGFGDRVELLRWRDTDHFDRWKVVLSDGKPLKIQQTLHQLWATRNHIVLIDTAFKVSADQLFLFEKSALVEEVEKLIRNLTHEPQVTNTLIRNLTDEPQIAETLIYVIRRDQLEGTTTDPKHPPTVTAQLIKVPRETAHYIVDYNDSNGIVLHTVHSCATDASEIIRKFDDTAYQNDPQRDAINHRMRSLSGMIANGTDMDWIGSYVIDPAKNTVKTCLIQQDFCWGNPVYAYRNMTLEQPDHLDDIYWIFFGAWEDLMTQHVTELYEKYSYRQIQIKGPDPDNTVLGITQTGRANTLCRVHIERHLTESEGLGLKLTTPDVYAFPPGYFANSPQFIPRQGGDGSATDGYLLCVVLFQSPEDAAQDCSEYWLFDAANLQKGPKYRLCSDQIKMGFSIHTTWLPKVKPPPPASYSIQNDFEPAVTTMVNKYQKSSSPEKQQLARDIRALFDTVYARFGQ